MPDALEEYCAWMERIAAAVETEGEHRRLELELFLKRVEYQDGSYACKVLSAATTFLDAQDYEKRPWEDDSSCLFTAMDYSHLNLLALLQSALALGDEYTRRTAAKWLPKYVREKVSKPLLIGLLTDAQPRVRWWAAIHLSRMAPKTEGLVAVLLEAMKGKWTSSARLNWQFTFSGRGEAAEALGHLGDAAREALPDLTEILECVRREPRRGIYYDEQLAARAIWRIAGEEALRLLAPYRHLDPAMAELLDEIALVERGGALPNPHQPRHACFVARFLWREGEDSYWMHATPDARGAV